MKPNYLIFLMLLSLPFQLFSQIANDDRVMIQGFNWESHDAISSGWYNHLSSTAAELGTAGFDLIWMPPPSNSGDPHGYLPRELNNMSNSYGNASDHASMITAFHNEGMEVIADLVMNHRVGCSDWVDFCNPTWDTWSIVDNDEVWSEPAYSNVFPRGGGDTGTSYSAARDLDHANPAVEQGYKDWMNNVLKGMGYDGWRYDFVHGYDPSYTSSYNAATNPTFSVGEYWTSDKQVIQDWIDASGSAAFDFPTYFSLKGAIRDNDWSYLGFNGAASGGIGWDAQHYVTFIENHDTPDHDAVNNVLNGNNVGSAYAYLLTHPGVPTVFYTHYFDWGSSVKQEITDLIGARKDAGVHNQSALTIHAAQANIYAATINGTSHDLTVKLGSGSWSPASAGLAGDWTLVTSGNNYAVWENAVAAVTTYDITVYVQDYTTAYAWDSTGTALLGAWPGTAMTDNGDGWNTITYSSPDSCSNILFSNGGTNQTVDLVTCGGYIYPNDIPDPASYDITVYVQGFTTAYAWSDLGTALLGEWPGTTMTDNGSGWNTVTYSSPDSCSNIIFSNAGADPTADLVTCGGYYYNGVFNPNPPSSGGGCLPPANTNAAVNSVSSALVSWDEVPGATYYQVRYRLHQTSSWFTIGTANLQRNLPGLNSKRYYQYKVRAQCADGSWSENTDIKLFYTSLCNVPIGASSIYLDETRVRIRWDADPTIIKNKVRYRAVGASTWELKGSTPGNNFLYINGLTANTDYEYRVRGNCDGNDWSAYSDLLTFSTAAAGQRQAQEVESIVGLSSYPNPVREELNIRYESIEANETRIIISDVLGKQILSQTVNAVEGLNTETISVSELEKGYYFLTIQCNKSVKTIKFIKSAL